jgi:tRNA nucleotidyltransferase (CCA-adding enzyme)
MHFMKKNIYKPKSELENFGFTIHNLLVENFSQTFFVGGMIRDLLLEKEIIDVDIATEATPKKVLKLLRSNNVDTGVQGERFGIIVAKWKSYKIEIATLREDSYFGSRYPQTKFITDIRRDSTRRDFTINALYLQPTTGKIYDFHKGLEDLQKKTIRFIGTPVTRIMEDPLRSIRALRFALNLQFEFDAKTLRAIKECFPEIKKLTVARIESEINKIKLKKNKKIVLEVINNPLALDKYFK